MAARCAAGAAVTAALWIVELAVARATALPEGDTLDRAAFFEWVWAECGDGLVGLDEGAIDVAEAAAHGIVASPRVLDAATAPADRDWVAAQPTASAACWFADEAAARAAVGRLTCVRGCTVTGLRRQPIDSGDISWRSRFAAVAVPGFGTIHPAWEIGCPRSGADGTTMFIDPGIGFGTGLHETTQLCLQALAAWVADGGRLDRVLDFGSGSGILGIAAAIHGAAHVTAVEIDGSTHAAIRANADRNGVADRVRVAASLPDDHAAADLVFANILAPVLLAASGHLAAALRPDRRARLVLSGLLADDVAEVAGRYAASLGPPSSHACMGDWHRLEFTTGE